MKNLPKEKESNEMPKSSANVVVDLDSEDWACLAHDEGLNMAIDLCRHIECAPGFEDWLEEEEDGYRKKKEISVVYQIVLKVLDEPDPPVVNKRCVILNSGATKHISPYKEDFLDLHPIDLKPFDTLSKPIYAIEIRMLAVDMPNGDSSSRLNIENVHYTPMSPYTLLSQGSFD
ncbi:hypothetical protein ACEPAF_1088 [Sanghuangporus sanghuang]